ncbi:MAG: adenylate/guanylate cyclase domain-containing protein [Proteobacteria bacterium]|nr:adenylate/guanylate cyclase domain-containing protein [Pseudomonadota bacterium]
MAGLAVLALLMAVWAWPGSPARAPLRERALDVVLAWLPRPPATDTGGTRVVIVDIDRATLDRVGPWPWPRARLADLVDAVAAGKPAALALDILLAGPDRFSSPAGPGGANAGDLRLAAALAAAPSVLGFGLDESGPAGPPGVPVLLAAPLSVPAIWRAAGLAEPPAVLAAATQGLGALPLAGDRDGPIRRVPLLVLAGDALRPGLAVEAVRVAQQAGSLLVDADERLQAGAITVPLGPDAALRLLPQSAPGAWEARTLPAWRVLGDPAEASRVAGRIVLIGSSAPELGGLRATPAARLTPSVQIQAEAADAMLRGATAWRPGWLGPAEDAAAVLLGLLGLALALGLRPWPAMAGMGAACVLWTGGAAAAVPTLALLPDPAGPPLIALGGFVAALLARFARDELAARRLRASFEQHLAPGVVARLVADPRAVRLQGETREITALFTDIEGFTAMTERADPAELVALLDRYFDMAARVVTEHGGMVGKFVGDAVQGIFNAPLDLPDHPRRAVACALALLRETEALRGSDLGRRLGLGRTRIGIETGPAIVGDVGGSRKLDYTAYGNAMNTAARLEEANKRLGSSICIGPGTAALLDPETVREIGTLTLRGQSQEIRVVTPAALAAATPGASAPPP